MRFALRSDTPKRSLKLSAYVAGVLFIDIGRAWQAGDPTNGNQGVLTDVGLGLRVGSRKSSNKIVFHFDIPFPLSGDGTLDDRQVRFKDM